MGMLLLILGSFSVKETSSTCHTFMGMSSCRQQTDQSFIGVSWWFVNMYHSKALVRIVQDHILRDGLFKPIFDASESLSAAKDLLEEEIFWALFDQTMLYIRDFRGEPTELLYDDTVAPLDLYRSYRQNADDILDLIITIQREGGYTAELNKQIPRILKLIEAASHIINTLPDVSETRVFKMLQRSALEAVADGDELDAKTIAGVSSFLNIASKFVDAAKRR